MISGIGRSGDDLGVNILNNMIKEISETQNNLTEKMMKVSVEEQVNASQEGLGENVDESV